MSNNPRTNFLHMQVPQVPQITDNDFKVLCYLHYLDKDNGDKTVAVLLENDKFAVKAHKKYALEMEARMDRHFAKKYPHSATTSASGTAAH